MNNTSNVIKDINDLNKKLLDWKTNYTRAEHSFFSNKISIQKSKKLLIVNRTIFEQLYDSLKEIKLNILNLSSTHKDILTQDNTKKINELLEKLKLNEDAILYKYIQSISNMQSELSETKSKKRDITFLIVGLLGGFGLSLLPPLFLEKEETKILNENFSNQNKFITNEFVDLKSKINKVDSLQFLLDSCKKQKCMR